MTRPLPRIPKGFRDVFAADVRARNAAIATVREVYERYGFEPLDTPAIEYLDALGKHLPDSDAPDGGVFAFRDEEDEWVALRYDLTAPLSRVVAMLGTQLPMPFRRYQVGPVWRREKPGPGRFREFYQLDVDTVGAATMAADAEVCCVLADAIEALGVGRGQYQVRVNDRKVLDGVLETIGLPPDPTEQGRGRRLAVLRAIDKYDRLGLAGVRDLLGPGRRDESGDFTPGAGLAPAAIDAVLAFMEAGGPDRAGVCDALAALVGDSEVGRQGVAELRAIDAALAAAGRGPDRVAFDPGIVRGLAYYTGPVFEAHLTVEIRDEQGARRPFGAVAGGGRYDDLVARFSGAAVPATGASIGVDRLLAALKALDPAAAAGAGGRGPVVVTRMDRAREADYLRMVTELREAGIAAEPYLGEGEFRAQMKYADRRRAPAAVIAGSDEFAAGTVAIKDLGRGRALAATVATREQWRQDKPAQITVPRGELVARVRALLGD